MIRDDWFTVQKIDSDTYAISEYGHWEKVHSFLLVGRDKAILIDTGLGIGNIRTITDQLTDLPVEVLTTHVHADHIGSHGQFDKFYVHEDELDWIVNGIKGRTDEQIRKDMTRDITIPTPSGFDPEAYRPFRGVPAGTLKEGDAFDLGGRILRIYHTPGHSPGHVTIHDETKGYLFTGDLLYDGTPVYAFYPTTSPEDLIRSLERIADIPGVSRIFGSHNTLGLDPEILQEVKAAAGGLRERNLVRFGTGTHRFKSFSVQF
ncbi:Glyoxylase, beta-lactamase superfamily II [Bhargavaea ginsengi]|uniref:Glyoxylase, beta-lactamase superfamily II n=1 Tax=Bhargavaea ginsengi TaxID=426757 RepID=A0A1H6ZPC9_9BACL|nr:MBL fold metallo-hydrolase [Bhargavaea ginsengi]SEJ55118.1 Glyoxylase, beta-lactamase superfamily II [Bhargavaea ginsengi]